MRLNKTFFITGYVVRKISKHIDCVSCIQSLLLSQTSIDHNYPIPQLYTKLTSFKNFGGLFLSSKSSYKVIIETEKYYLYLTNNLTKINVPNLQKKKIFFMLLINLHWILIFLIA